MYAFRQCDRNWGGIYTCSDFERKKYIYKIPISEIIKILELAGSDYPKTVTMTYSELKGDYVVKTN